MKNLRPFFFILILCVSSAFLEPEPIETGADDYWVSICDANYSCGYLSSKGDTVIPIGKYLICATDTFRTYAKVLPPHSNWIGIDRNEKVLYEIHLFDNGPDYPSEGLFRIWKNGKMGYADERTGKIILYPQYACGFPFEKGLAKVTFKCDETPPDNEGHRVWLSDEWFYIDHTGKRTEAPK